MFTTLISKDNKTNERVYLFVGFTEQVDGHHYSHSFMVFDKDKNPITKFLTRKESAAKYIPNDILNKGLITNIITNMTRILLNKYLPERIVRETVQLLPESSLVRYQKISEILINEYNYELENEIIDPSGLRKWYFKRKDINALNEDMEDEYELQQWYTDEEIATIAFSEAARVLSKTMKG